MAFYVRICRDMACFLIFYSIKYFLLLSIINEFLCYGKIKKKRKINFVEFVLVKAFICLKQKIFVGMENVFYFYLYYFKQFRSIRYRRQKDRGNSEDSAGPSHSTADESETWSAEEDGDEVDDCSFHSLLSIV